MAESFTTTNRFFDNKYYPRGSLAMVTSPLKKHSCWNVMAMPLMNWISASVSLRLWKKSSLLKFVAAFVNL